MPSLRARFIIHTVPAWLALAFIFVIVSASPLYADEADQDRARAARLSGQVAPLSDLLALIEGAYPGQVLKVELEGADDNNKKNNAGRDGDFVYEIKILTLYGNLVKLKYDAKSLKLLQVEGDNSTD